VSSTAQVRDWRARHQDQQRATSKAYYEKNKPLLAEKAQQYRQVNKTKIDARIKRWAAENPERARAIKNKSTWRRNGVAPLEALQALAAHDGRCGCCGTDKPKENRWCVDHDHVTGKVRGILCSKCNTAIGKLGDTLEGVLRAVKYLQQSQGATQ
jgi:hypothetical protein